MSNGTLLQDFRIILRHVRSLSSMGSKTSSIRKHVIDQFNSGKMESNAEKIKLLRSNAHNYACLISSVKELTHLRGLDTGEALSPREKVIQSARRVGLSVPNFSDQYNP